MYPQWEPQNLARAVPSLGPDGVDLLSVNHLMLELDFLCIVLSMSLLTCNTLECAIPIKSKSVSTMGPK